MISIYDIEKKAKEFDVPIEWAIQRRIVHLKSQMKECANMIDYFLSYEGTEMNEQVAGEMAKIENDKFLTLAKEVRVLALAMRKTTKKPPDDHITEEMIAIAKAHPIDKIVCFHNGAAIAWCHDDRNPSLTWDKKRNRAKCWPCDKSFDPIQVLRERDGLSFHQAVRQLQ
jgi:hypothetical protein